MTVASAVSRITVAGNSSATSFAFPFKITSSSHLVVTKTTSAGITSTLTLGTHYSVSGVGSESGGSITYPLSGTALPTGDTITMRRVVPLTQTVDLANQGAFYAEVHEAEFDNLTYITQQISDDLTALDAIVDGLIGDVPGALRAYTFAGDGATVLFSLGVTLTGGVRSVIVAVDGVLQAIDTYAVSGTSLVFSEAPPYDSVIDVRVVGETVSASVTLADTSLVTATGSTTARALSDRAVDTLNVRDFGAIGDGATDDTVAINAMFAYVRAHYSTTLVPQGAIPRAYFGPGTFMITGSINATGLRAMGTLIDGGGAVILAKCTGLPVFDMMGSRWYHIRDLNIWGHATSTPSYGLLMGRVTLTASSAGDGTIEDVHIHGTYSKSCVYNYACETVLFVKCRLYNRSVVANSYCLIQDGANCQGVVSAFIGQAKPANDPDSFNENTFIGCDFRKETSGKTVLYTGTGSFPARHHFFGCYMVSVNDAIFYVSGLTEVRQLILDVHVEVDTATHTLLVNTDSVAGNVSMPGLQIRDHQPQCATAILDCTSSAYVLLLDGLRIELGRPANPGIPIFGTTATASKILACGEITWESSEVLILSGAYFNGVVRTRLSTVITHTLGTYELVLRPESTDNRIATTKGYVRITGNPENGTITNYAEINGDTTARFRAGGTGTNISASVESKGSAEAFLYSNGAVAFAAQNQATGAVNYLSARGTTGNPSLVATGTSTDLDLTLTPKGTGVLKFGTHSALAAETVTGFITVRDAGGTLRKIAVVS